MEYNRSFFLAVAFSLGIIFVWQVFFVSPANKDQQAQVQAAHRVEQQIAQEKANPAAPSDMAVSPSDRFSDSAAAAGHALAEMTVQSRAAALAQTPRVAIDTPQLAGSLNLIGGAVDDLFLKNYYLTVQGKKSKNPAERIALLNPQGFKESYFFQFGYMANGVNALLPNNKTQWRLEGVNKQLTPQTPITLVYDNGGLGADGKSGGVHLIFRRLVSVDDNFMFTVRDEVKNESGESVSLRFGARTLRNAPPADIEHASYLLHEGLIGVMGDDGLQTQTYKKLAKQTGEDRRQSFGAAQGGWIGITDKYWAVALIPDQNKQFQGQFSYDSTGDNTVYQSAFADIPVAVGSGQSVRFDGRAFAGAKLVDMLNHYENGDAAAGAGPIKKFDLLIDWGLLRIITQPMFKLIDMLYKLVGNFGIAILLVTVLLKAVLFPLANKSYKSMARMKKIQPAMTELRKKYADDKVKLQQATMELYRKEKVNPLAGCWPLIIQFPIFFALYKVLYITIEMRQTPFFGWIQDLSAPDPTSIFNLFGLIPLDLPHFLMIGAWPVIMGITMFLQMRMNPTPPDATQAMIFTWMPLVFTWMLAAFPAGLVIYWAWNNTLSIIQQSIIMKRQGVKIELLDNLKSVFSKKHKQALQAARGAQAGHAAARTQENGAEGGKALSAGQGKKKSRKNRQKNK